ncbi:Alpha/Beta hydrolase protein [Ilyonectria robusta]|uniref:Alpha/Beta hydrolase protein n=1 Tax=Ilyonectria robusta TaxID=1079257 RepID=UPI001E8DB1F2|nr:Alpha/Beta hydrolase protein [Ilyonectria robusta]KAH8688281.1 Alpha/Beta hydrolase protein [Ilyonectria robusta]
MATSEPSENDPELFYISLNDDKPTTIVLLHGLLNSHLEWEFVIPHLTDYHILAPDISGHSRSRDILPADLCTSADRVAALIRKHAKGGRAHVVGLSMGAFVTLRLSQRHRELVWSAFVTAGHPMEGRWAWVVGHPRVTFYVMLFLLEAVPRRLYLAVAARHGMRRHEALLGEMRQNRRWDVIRDVDLGLLELTWDDVRALPVKTLSIAAGNVDDVEAVRRMGREMPVEGSLGVVVRGAVHTWNLQKPELFAEGIKAWIEGRGLPEELEVLT